MGRWRCRDDQQRAPARHCPRYTLTQSPLILLTPVNSGEPKGKVPLAKAKPDRARPPGDGPVPVPQRGLARVCRRLAGSV